MQKSKVEYIESDSDESVSNNESDFETDTQDLDSSEVNLSVGQSISKPTENNVDSKDLSPNSKVNKKLKKKLMKKITFRKNYDTIDELFISRDKLQEIINIKEKELLLLRNQVKKFNKKIYSSYKNLSKIHERELKGARKEKRKLTKVNRGGFQKKRSIPDKLQKYIGKEIMEEKNVNPNEANLPEIFKVLNAAFKRDNLKVERDTVISTKKIAKQLGVELNKKILWKDHMPFIKSYF